MTKFTKVNDAYKDFFTTPNGKVVLGHLIEQVGFNKSPAILDNVNTTYYKIGQHDVIRSILFQLNISEEEINNIIKQYNQMGDF